MSKKHESEETPSMDDVKKEALDPGSIKKGDLMACVYWGKVTKVENGGKDLSLEGMDVLAGMPFGVHGEPLVKGSYSADRFEKEMKVSKTEAATKLISCYNRPFTVCFDRQEADKEGNKERVLRGRLVQPEPLLGRSTVEDLDEPEGRRIRLVDHRSIKWLIVDGIKFIVGRK